MSDKPRPSSLPNLAACPRWVNRPKVEDEEEKDSLDLAADEGTLVHEKMEALAEVALEKWEDTIWSDPDLGPALSPIVIEAASQVRDLFSLGLPVTTKRSLGLMPDDHYELTDCLPHGFTNAPLADGIYCEVGLDSGVAKPGTADVVMITGNSAVLVDYKTNRVIRSHLQQQLAYVVGLFEAVPRLEFIEVRIVAPRLGDAHQPETFSREKDLPEIVAELENIVAKAGDPFEPGCPGAQCATCAGNGRCCWQAATLRDIPVEITSLVKPGLWLSLVQPPTLEMRGQRKQLAKWLEPFLKAVKEDDQKWSLTHTEDEIPGFKKSIQAGRSSVDKTRLAELNAALALRFGLSAEVMMAFSMPIVDQLAEYVALGQGMTQEVAKTEIKRAINPFTKRGNDIVKFLVVKPKKGELKA